MYKYNKVLNTIPVHITIYYSFNTVCKRAISNRRLYENVIISFVCPGIFYTLLHSEPCLSCDHSGIWTWDWYGPSGVGIKPPHLFKLTDASICYISAAEDSSEGNCHKVNIITVKGIYLSLKIQWYIYYWKFSDISTYHWKFSNISITESSEMFVYNV